MKKLILTLLLPLSVLAAPEMQELSDTELKKKFISVMKDTEIENLIGNTKEFKECIDKHNKFDPKNPNLNEENAQKAENCFKEKLGSHKGKLEALSDKLGLQSYGLVQSKNVQDISNYLGDKMYKALTGIDRKEKQTKEMLKFKNRKMVDQKVFIELFSTQLAKSALFEISRFCFENLRKASNPDAKTTNFTTYWAAELASPKNVSLSSLTDIGQGGYGNITDPSKKETVYKDIFNGISSESNFQPQHFSSFFDMCAQSITPLCKEFEGKASTATPMAVGGTPTRGSTACLTRSRLLEIRRALANATKINEQFQEQDFVEGVMVALDKGEIPKFYDKGKSNETDSIDNLTNFSSADMLEGKNKQREELAYKCATKPELSECEEFLAVGNARLQAEHSVDMEMRLKKEIEKAKIAELKDAKLKEYLEKNGYFDLASKVDAMSADEIQTEIDKIYEAKRVATLEGIRSKIGKRQVSESELKQMGGDTDNEKQKLMQENATQVHEEKARLAQVILFNNIITSHLELKKKDSSGKTEDAGRNVNTLKKEISGLETAQVDPTLFKGLKDSVKDNGSSGTKDSSIVGVEMLDPILGKQEDKKAK